MACVTACRRLRREGNERVLRVLLLAMALGGGLTAGCVGCAAAGAAGGEGQKRAVAREDASPGRMIRGTGCVTSTSDAAADRMTADERARAEVAKQIRVSVVQVAEEVQREEKSGGGEVTSSYAVSVQTREVVDRNLEGVRIVERRRDPPPGETCAVAVLDKGVMAARLREELDGSIQEIDASLRAAARADQSGQPTEALRGRSLALLALPSAAVEAGMLRDLGYAASPLPVRADLRHTWSSTLQEIQIQVLAGEGQKAEPGRPLPQPFRLRAHGAGNVPAGDLPLRVLRAPDGVEMQRSARTDASGETSLQVFRVGPGQEAIQRIVVGLDWERLLAGKGGSPAESAWDRWDARETVLTYRVPIPGDFRVGVAVYDAGTGKVLARSPLESALLEGLQRTGFVTRELSALPGGVAESLGRKPTVEEACRSLRGNLDILLVGDVSVGAPRTSSYELVFCRSGMKIRGIDLSTGRTLLSLEVRGKGGGLDEASAVRKSKEDLGKKLRQEVGRKLADALP